MFNEKRKLKKKVSDLESQIDLLFSVLRTDIRMGLRPERAIYLEITPERLAYMFHKEYERMAPLFGYETRLETKEFDKDSENGKLMIATCEEIIHQIRGV